MQKSNHSGNQQLRIIGGKWRGRKLSIANIDGLRPTGDRIRETLFNWLMQDVPGSHCLDLFAGSGALGLECLSRGANSVVMLEKDASASHLLQQHCEKLDTPADQVVNTDALHWINTYQGAAFNIVFIDPPFELALWDKTIEQLNNPCLLSDQALIYIETPATTILTIPSNWSLFREKKAGAICYRLYQYHCHLVAV